MKNAAGNIVQIATGSGADISWAWNGRDTLDALQPEGTYRGYLLATDSVGTSTSDAAQVLLDLTAPNTDAMGPRYVDEPSMAIQWSVTDPAGAEYFDVMVRDGNGDWGPWLTQATVTSDTYAGEYDHVYFFEARAMDNAGNLEELAGANGNGAVIVGPDPASTAPLPEGGEVFSDGHCTGQVIRVRLGDEGSAGRALNYSVDSPDDGVHCVVTFEAPTEDAQLDVPQENDQNTDHEGEDRCGPGASKTPGPADYHYVSASHTIQDAPTIDVVRLVLHYRYYFDGNKAYAHSSTNPGWCQLYTYAAGFPASGLWEVKPESPSLYFYEWHSCPGGGCIKTYARGSSYYHTDFAHCNFTTEWQDAWMQNNAFGYFNGEISRKSDPQTIFYDSFPCWGLQSATYYKRHHAHWEEKMGQ